MLVQAVYAICPQSTFRYRDRLTGKWVRARYVAERSVIASQYQAWEITGPPEIRSGVGGSFNPWRD